MNYFEELKKTKVDDNVKKHFQYQLRKNGLPLLTIDESVFLKEISELNLIKANNVTPKDLEKKQSTLIGKYLIFMLNNLEIKKLINIKSHQDNHKEISINITDYGINLYNKISKFQIFSKDLD
jgi:hypothetical protein